MSTLVVGYLFFKYRESSHIVQIYMKSEVWFLEWIGKSHTVQIKRFPWSHLHMQGPPVFLPILIQFGSFWKYPPKIHIYVSFFVKKYKEAWEFFEKRTRFIVITTTNKWLWELTEKTVVHAHIFSCAKNKQARKKGGPISSLNTSCKGYMSHVNAANS